MELGYKLKHMSRIFIINKVFTLSDKDQVYFLIN